MVHQKSFLLKNIVIVSSIISLIAGFIFLFTIKNIFLPSIALSITIYYSIIYILIKYNKFNIARNLFFFATLFILCGICFILPRGNNVYIYYPVLLAMILNFYKWKKHTLLLITFLISTIIAMLLGFTNSGRLTLY